MGERDAFGREQGEDSLSDMGWSAGSSNAPRPAATPRPAQRAVSHESLPGMNADVNHDGVPGTHAPPPRTFETGRPAPRRRRNGSALGSLLKGVVPLLFVIFVGGSVLLGIIGAVTDAVDSADTPDIEIPSPVVPSLDDGDETDADEPSAAVPEAPAAPAAPPEGLQPGSMLLASNFAAVKKKMRTGQYGRLKNLSIRPERINAQFVTKAGALRNVTFEPGGKVDKGSLSGSGFSALPTIPIAPINTAAPYRMARSAAGRLKRSDTAVGYVVYYGESFVGNIVWGVYMKDGKIFQGDARGKIIRQL